MAVFMHAARAGDVPARNDDGRLLDYIETLVTVQTVRLYRGDKVFAAGGSHYYGSGRRVIGTRVSKYTCRLFSNDMAPLQCRAT